jgi:hypothetical protein
MLGLDVFQIVGDIGEVTTDIFETALFKVFLDSCIALRITINSDSAFFLIFFVVFVYIEIDHVKNEFFHVHAVFLLECKYALVVEEESQRTHCTKVAAKLVEYRTDIGNSTGRIVGQRIYKYSNAVRAVAFVCHALVVALVLTHCILDGTFDIVLRHVLTLTSGDNRTQCRVVFRFRTASLYGDGDLFAQTCKCFGHVAPSFQLGSFSIFKRSSHGSNVFILILNDSFN